MATQWVSTEELDLLTAELERSTKRIREAVALVKENGIEKLLIHWGYISNRHIPGITKAASDIRTKAEDAVEAKKSGRITNAEKALVNANIKGATLGRKPRNPKK